MPLSPATSAGSKRMLSALPLAISDESTAATEPSMAVGPNLSAPQAGPIPDAKGSPALRPEGRAAVNSPKATWHVTE